MLLAAGLLQGPGPAAAQTPGRLPNLDDSAIPLPPLSPPVTLARPFASSAPLSFYDYRSFVPVPDDGLTRPTARKPVYPTAITPAAFQMPFEAPSSPRDKVIPMRLPAPPGPPAGGSLVPMGGTPGGQVAVEVVGPATIAPGEPLPYEIVLRNVGTGILSQVRVEDNLPVGARYHSSDPPAEVKNGRMSWLIGTLEVGAERRIKVEIRPDGAEEMLLNPTVSATTAVGLRTRVVKPAFGVTVQAPQSVQRGGRAIFQIQVANNGVEPLKHVVARMTFPEGLQHASGGQVQADVGDLKPGEVRNLPPLEAVALRPGRFVVEAEAKADSGLKAQGRASLVVLEPALTLRLDGLRQGIVNRDHDLRVELANPASTASGTVKVSVSLPDGLDLVGLSGGGFLDPATKAVTWELAGVPAGTSTTLMLKVRPRQTGEWNLLALAVAPGLNDARAALNLRIEGAPALVLELAALDKSIAVGAETTIEMRLVNQGAASSPNVRVIARLPDGLTPLRVDGPTPGRIEQQQVLFEPLSQLVPRADAVYRIRVRGARPGNGSFRADVTADFLREPLTEELSTEVAP